MYIRLLLVTVFLGGCDRLETQGLPVLSDLDRDDRVIFFFDDSCPDCWLVKNELLLPLLEKNAILGAEVVYLDIATPSTLDLLRQLESVVGFDASVMAPIVVVGRRVYCGVSEIEEALTGEGDLAPVGQ